MGLQSFLRLSSNILSLIRQTGEFSVTFGSTKTWQAADRVPSFERVEWLLMPQVPLLPMLAVSCESKNKDS
ncbi:hypothetical protein KCU92_g341, partial [Aureobasidium melanogenum]